MVTRSWIFIRISNINLTLNKHAKYIKFKQTNIKIKIKVESKSKRKVLIWQIINYFSPFKFFSYDYCQFLHSSLFKYFLCFGLIWDFFCCVGCVWQVGWWRSSEYEEVYRGMERKYDIWYWTSNLKYCFTRLSRNKQEFKKVR